MDRVDKEELVEWLRYDEERDVNEDTLVRIPSGRTRSVQLTPPRLVLLPLLPLLASLLHLDDDDDEAPPSRLYPESDETLVASLEKVFTIELNVF